MPKRCRFRGPFDKQHGKGGIILLQSARQHFYHIYWSLSKQLSWKKSALLPCQILGLLVNILAVDYKCPVFKRNNLKIPIKMQLSQKEKPFYQFFAKFSKSSLNFEHFEKKMTLIDFVFSKLRTPKAELDKCLKSLVLEDPLISNIVKGTYYCCNLPDSTFIIFIYHC